MTYLAFFKSGPVAWRQIIKFDSLDACWILTQSDNIPLISVVKDYYIQEFPSLPSQCPIEPGKYYSQDVEIKGKKQESYQFNPRITVGDLPNGIYRHVISLSANHGPACFTLYWHVQIYNKMGEENF